MATPVEQYHHHPLSTSSQDAHPLSQQVRYYQPQQQQFYHQDQTPRSTHPAAAHSKNRSFSFHSERSHKSTGSKDLQETHAEKESKRLHTKADPLLAMSEAEPSAVAAMKTEPMAAPLRSMEHKDNLGNVIAEPDKSNPTRHRWERPLDTIRSFEAAIDGGYNRRSVYRADSESAVQWNRRSSYHPTQQPRFTHDSYYGSRPVSIMQDSHHYSIHPGTARNSYHEAQGYHGGYGQPGGRQRTSRMHSDPHYQQQQNVYPLPHKDRSYETVTSAAASGNSDHAGYHTDPTSSDNSSIDRPSPGKRAEPVNDYGIGFNQSQSYQTPTFSVGIPANRKPHPLPSVPGTPAQQYAPAVPQKKASVLRRQPPNQQQPPPPQQQQQQTATNDKRKSWFSRRFSKNA